MAVHPSRTTLKRALSAAVLQVFLVVTCLQVDRAFAFQVYPTGITTLHQRGMLPLSPSRGALPQRAAKFQEDEEDEEEPVFQQTSPVIQETSRILRRVSFLSWWSQVILTSVSGVILGFARSITVTRDAAIKGTDPSFILSSIGLCLSAVSVLWTWGNGARLSRRLTRRPVSRIQAAGMVRRAVRVGVTLNLAGLLVHLLAAEEIVGTLAIRVLTASSATRQAVMFAPMEGLQPLDVLVVQANTNSLLSHFCSLVAMLFLTRQIEKLDPPSTEDSKRNNSR
jgi:hypothetical protein